MASVWSVVRGQFMTLPYPAEDCSGRTIVITGANIGLGLESAKHFVRLNAARVILGCRNLEKAENAKKIIQDSTQRQGVVEVWQIDLTSFDSVKEFAARVNQLDRLDIFINNASMIAIKKELYEGHETQVTVNVISTALLSILVLPALRRSGQQFNITPHLVIVSSDGAFMNTLKEQKSPNIIKAMDDNAYILDQYTATKLLQLMFMKELAHAADASGKGHVIINSLNPGFCKTQLFRPYPFPITIFMWLFQALFAREPEMGSRTLLAAAFAGEETHGNWMTDCQLHVWPKTMRGEDGEKLTKRFWNELVEVLEEIQPGVTEII